ncbi:MAG TPA: Rieske (2Fe-2S) protein [Gaiellaceae bacterium]|jgi:ubiquinol-cytochrome c reductase iron-sulfur subunit|nr:Rieske (2Fe-2S) protein [Gaiellaceae bacterium]
MSRVKSLLIAAGVLLLGRGRPQHERSPKQRIVPPGPADRRAENLLLLFFAGVAVCGVAFIVFFAIDKLGHETQWLGLALGLAFALLTLACMVIARRLVVTEELPEPYPEDNPDDVETIEGLFDESGSRFTRKRLVKLAGAGALGTLGLAVLTPAASLGPALDTSELKQTPWHRGRRLVDESGRPIAATYIEAEAFYTAYPEGADRELIGSPLVVVRIGPGNAGVVAYSKICTHAGCAIALYRKPTFRDTEPGPALVCPCHYSSFDPAQNGKVIFGPAGRALPRLPLEIDGDGNLRAAGNFSGPVGPSWWGVRR